MPSGPAIDGPTVRPGRSGKGPTEDSGIVENPLYGALAAGQRLEVGAQSDQPSTPRPSIHQRVTSPMMRAVGGSDAPGSFAPPSAPPAQRAGTTTQRMQVIASPVRDRGVLMRVDGPAAGALFTLPEGSLTIGRDRSNAVAIEADGVSRQHAVIRSEPEGFVLEDRGSLNGVFVDGVRVNGHLLSDGEVIQLGPLVSYRFTYMDEQEEQALRRRLDSMTVDPLTGAFTREHFETRLRGEVSFARRHDATVSVAVFDVDHLEGINELHGRSVGDSVLRHVAAIATELLRLEDVMARWDAGEFVIMLRDTDLLGAAYVAERLRDTVAHSSLKLGQLEVPMTVSAGCASLECCRHLIPEQLLDQARCQLMFAKKAGRNVVRMADPLR